MRLLQGEEDAVYGDTAVYEMHPPCATLRIQCCVLARLTPGSVTGAAVVVIAGELCG